LLREGLLQQSAVSAADAYSDAARSAALADSVIAVADRCDALAGEGVAASVIEDQDYSALLRAREDAGTAEQVRAIAGMLLESLSALGQPGQAHD
jgi:V/A-type H+/Na+-transporting ATPase subunit A